MATEKTAQGSQQTNHTVATEQKTQGSNDSDPAIGFTGKIEAKYRHLKEDAETYPYVWASYAVVYGGFGLWFWYRWRKLRKTEDRVRALQQILRQRVLAEEAATADAASKSATSAENASSSAHVSKPPK